MWGKLGGGEAFVSVFNNTGPSNLTQCRGLPCSKSLGDSQQMDILQGWRENIVTGAPADKRWKNSLHPPPPDLPFA